jgi:Acetyltransferase (GNAT) domain
MPERFAVSFGMEVPGDALALESQAAVCNPHALPPCLRASRESGHVPSWLECRRPDGTLAGLWPLVLRRSWLGMSVLHAPLLPRYDLAGAPLVTAADAAKILRSMLTGLKDGLAPCKVVSISNLQADGAVWDSLLAMRDEGLISLAVLETWERAVLERGSAPDSAACLTASLSSGSRKRLRTKRRTLEEQGPLSLRVHTAPSAVALAGESFLSLEAAGWKGRSGTALRQNPADARYVMDTLQAMAEAERGFIAELRMGERCIASGLFLRCGGEVFFWKTTYDETLAKESPGVIFDMMLTDWLYQQPWFERLDTGSDDSVNPATLIWKQRRPMANVVIGLEPKAWGSTVLAAARRMRGWAKKVRNRLKWN